jgi:cytochrome bd-type quinol oxidase subunit 1
MLPRPDRPHDQLLTTVRTESVVATVGGLLLGYMGWLVAISIGAAFTTVSLWSLIVLVVSVLLVIAAGLWGWRLRRRGRYPWAMFVWMLPIPAVLLTLAVLRSTYL